MIFEVILGHGSLLAALEYGDQAQECKGGNMYATNIEGGDGALCLVCLDGRVIPSKIMVVHGEDCCGLLL